MQVEIDDIGVAKIRWAEFSAGISLSDQHLVCFAPVDRQPGLQRRWMVLDHNQDPKKGSITVYSAEEMKLLYRRLKKADGSPIKVDRDVAYRFLVQAGKLRMKIREGCAGCRRFWREPGAEGQCVKCQRCYACCGKESVPYSCAARHLQEVVRTKRSHYRQYG